MLSAIFTGCQSDYLGKSAAGQGMELSLSVPAPEPVSVYSSAPTSNECYTDNAAVLVVDDQSTVTAAEYIKAITDNGTQAPKLRLITLRPEDNDRIVVVANFDPAVTESAVAGCIGQPLSNARNVIRSVTSTVDASTSALSTPLLMSGEGIWGSGATVQMSFQVAKVSVALYPSAGNISVESFSCYASAGNTLWNTADLTAQDGITHSSGNRAMTGYPQQVTGDDTPVTRGIYLYEEPTVPASYLGDMRSLYCVVLKVTNPDTEVGSAGGEGYICLTYDQLGTDGSMQTYRPFTRGNHYIFRVKNIYGRGYATVEEAMANPGNAVYDVAVTDDWNTSVKYNGQYAMVTAVDTVFVQFPMTQKTELTRFGIVRPDGNTGSHVTLRKISLVRVNASDKSLVTVPSSELQLFGGTDGATSGGSSNTITLTAGTQIPEDGYRLYYTAPATIQPGMYLRIEYGNIEEFIAVVSTTFSASDIVATYQGGEFPTNIVAQAWYPGQAATEPLQVETQWTDADGNIVEKPAWVDIDEHNDHNITIHPQVLSTEITWPAAPAQQPYDLSTRGGSAPRRTANCYMVHAPGTYSLPLVYGNAIDETLFPADGVNEGAYNPGAAYGVSGSYVLTQFADHAGVGINSPYIYESNSGANAPTDAMLLWQDVDGMIDESSVRLSDDGHSILFTVDADRIAHGNALISAIQGSRTNPTIVWNWQIWVTDYDPDAAGGTITTGPDAEVMIQTLGYCPGEEYAGRETYLRLLYDNTEVGSLTITQNAYTAALGNQTHYERGRPVMLPGITTVSGYRVKTLYGPFPYQTGYVTSSILHAIISRPYRYHTAGSMYFRYNSWRISYGSNPTQTVASEKTVYDPCPPGYRVCDISTWDRSVNTDPNLRFANTRYYNGSPTSTTCMWNADNGYTPTRIPYFYRNMRQTSPVTNDNNALAVVGQRE